MNYYLKYLKYKHKYDNLKLQYGSGKELDKFEKNQTVINIIDTLYRLSARHDRPSRMSMIQQFKNLQTLFDADKLKTELESLNDEEQKAFLTSKRMLLFRNFCENITMEETALVKPGFLELFNFFGVAIKKSCSVEEYMTLDNPVDMCNNPTLVYGSCGSPNFLSGIHGLNENNDKIVEFLELLMKTNITKKKVNIVLGSRKIPESTNIYVTFDEGTSGKNIDLFIKELKCGVLNSSYHLKSYFPLNTDGTNKLVLDKIHEMTKNFKVSIINKMCGTCHRSLYYLVQNGNANLSYTVNPEQGLDSITDTEDIKKCFKK